MCKQKICNKLKTIYNETNFFTVTITFLILAVADFVITEILILGLFLKNNFLIVYTTDKIDALKTSGVQPYTHEQSVELMNTVNNIVQPYIVLHYFLIFAAFVCFIIEIYKIIQRKSKNV